HTCRARREIQVVLQSLDHFLVHQPLPLHPDMHIAIPEYHPELTPARLGPSLNGKVVLAPYFPFVDNLAIRTISTPIDVGVPFDKWINVHREVHADRRRRTQIRSL